MSERYWITGVQLGILHASNDESVRKKLIEDIVEKQFIGNYYTEEEQKQFKKKISKFDDLK